MRWPARSNGSRALLQRARTITQETLLWDATHGTARSMRSKEESQDYRYFPDPDLPPLVLTARCRSRARAALPELPATREQRFRETYALPPYDAGVLTASRELADYVRGRRRRQRDAKAASNWVMTNVLGWLNQRQLTD